MYIFNRSLLAPAVFAAALFLGQSCEASSARSDAGSSSASTATASTSTAASPFDKPGFVTGVKDGRLWVFRADSDAGKAFKANGATPARHVVRPGVGPAGMTVRAPDAEDIVAYMMARPGFEVVEADGRFWIYREGTKEHAAFKESGSHPARHVVRPGAGPMGTTLRSPELKYITEYLGTKPGFHVVEASERLWVYKIDSPEYDEFMAKGSHPARHVVRPGAGPGGVTLRSPEMAYIEEYVVTQEGFITGIRDGRLWVFLADSKEGAAFAANGAVPARHVVRPGVGPLGMTVRSPDGPIIDAYLRAAGLAN
ncbi:MAG: hypothetical protein EA402_07950 [Planctomycetota bacterium]|nr:MAG: hypothetical protein EA402_07950 [Planctomycetota bacterium]